MITVLRGSSGSGKSFIAYKLLETVPNEPIFWPANTPPNTNKTKPRIMGYHFAGDLFLVGPYTARKCGGADSISGGFPKAQLPFLERAARKFKHVLFESLMGAVCKNEDWVDLRTRLETDRISSLPVIFPTMNTPQELCLERIRERNGGKSFNIGATNANWRRVNKHRQTLEDYGFYAPYIDHTRAYEHTVELLRWGGWNPEEAADE